MSAALLLLAAALVLWPSRRRLARRSVGLRSSGWVRALRSPEAPLPLVAGCAVAGLAAVLSTPLVAVLAGVCAGLAGRSWRERLRVAREETQLAALVEGLAALSAELRSGRPVAAAVSVAREACGDPGCARALSAALTGLHLERAGPAPGAHPRAGPVAEALVRVASAARLSARTGCSLAAVVGAVEDDLRARLRHRRQLRSATAGPHASAALLAGLPVLGLLMGSGVGAEPWRVLTTGSGQLLLVLGVLLEVTGVVWSGRLVRRALR